jgi:sugar (pentulose or hexulose) kinase
VADVVIGVDLGTSACKALAFTATGRRVAAARAPYATRIVGDQSTQRPADWLGAVRDCLGAVARQLTDDRVAGIGLSGQIGTHLLTDAAVCPLGDAVTWQDGRSGAYVARVQAGLGGDWLARELDTWLPPSGVWPLPRLAWFEAEYPGQVERARYLLGAKDYVIWWLTGRVVSDPSSWRGLARSDGTVVTAALARLGLPDLAPPLAGPSAVAGGLGPEAAAATGLARGTPVVVGLSDLNAALIGIGAMATGTMFDVGGTSEHLGGITGQAAGGDRVATVPLPAVDTSRYAVYGVTSNAGSVITWLRQLLSLDGDALFAAAGQSQPGARGLLCVPYLHGERAPLWDARARGGFVGLTSGHAAGDFARAALEGIACNLRAIRALLPATLDGPVRTTGGTAGNPAWNLIKASVLNTPLVQPREPEAASLGAAILAAAGTGLTADVEAGSQAMVATAGRTDPDPALVAAYDDLYPRYERAAALVRDLRSDE